MPRPKVLCGPALPTLLTLAYDPFMTFFFSFSHHVPFQKHFYFEGTYRSIANIKVFRIE